VLVDGCLVTTGAVFLSSAVEELELDDLDLTLAGSADFVLLPEDVVSGLGSEVEEEVDFDFDFSISAGLTSLVC